MSEYEKVIAAAERQVNSAMSTCQWWLGLFNWNDGSPNSVDAYLSSSENATIAPNHNKPNGGPTGNISNFITVRDGNDGGTQNCVHTNYNWFAWRDDKCTKSLPFICQTCSPPTGKTFSVFFLQSTSICPQNIKS